MNKSNKLVKYQLIKYLSSKTPKKEKCVNVLNFKQREMELFLGNFIQTFSVESYISPTT